MTTELVELLRAKSCHDEGRKYLLKDHIEGLFSELERFRKYTENNKHKLSYPDIYSKDIFENLAKAVFLHDLGKIDYNFQRNVFRNKEGGYDEKWETVKNFLHDLYGNDKVRHEILSIIWSIVFLGNEKWDKKIRTAILLHHYNRFYLEEKELMGIVQRYKEQIERYSRFIIENKNKMKDIIKGLVHYLNGKIPDDFYNIIFEMTKNADYDILKEFYKKIKDYDDDISDMGTFYEVDNENVDYSFLVFLGLLRRCDYSASGDVNIENTKNINDVFKEIENKIKTYINIPAERSIWQEEAIRNYNEDLLVLIAPTGSGKTEFALLWGKEKGRKFIYTLPLRVAINDLYLRFKNFFDYKDELSILHSTAFIEYINEEKEGSKEIRTDTKITSSKLFSYPIMLTTPDQVFLTSLNYYGSDKLISVYPFSSIVIDEIQTYKPEMAAIILKTVEIIRALRGNILIITATFPPYFQKFLKDFKIVDSINMKELNTIKNINIKRHKISIVEKNLFEFKKEKDDHKNGIKILESKKKFIKDITNKKGRKLFIVNTVSKAICLYEEIKEIADKKEDVFLLHSRLIEKEKNERISKIKERIKENEDVILVSTQIVEASVDIDFDVLITEISTIDSQIQRWGRIFRKRDKNYEESDPNIWIFVGEKNEKKWKIDPYTKYIYDDEVMQKTIETLKEYENKLLSYREEREMIQKTFEKKTSEEKSLKEKYEEEIEEMKNDLKYFTVEKKSQAQRLFRDIMGYRVVIPQLMEEYQEFAKLVQDSEASKMTWEEIIKKMSKRDIDKWHLKKILYDFSFTIPSYYFEKYRYNIISHEFKGFYVLKELKSKKDKENIYEEIKEYGFDKIKDVLSIDKEMINII